MAITVSVPMWCAAVMLALLAVSCVVFALDDATKNEKPSNRATVMFFASPILFALSSGVGLVALMIARS